MDQTTQRLRDLARRVQEIAMLPIQETRRQQWRGLNDLKMVKPMVYTRDYVWDMVKIGDELQTTIEDEFYRGLEFQLLTTIFQWEHLQADRVVEPVVQCPVKVVNHTPIYFKIRYSGQTEAILTTERDNFQNTAVDYEQQIFDEEDIDRVIPMPQIEVVDSTLDREWGRVNEIFDGILPVEKKGVDKFSFTPWDDVFRLFSIEEGMMNLYTEPDLMHKAVKRYVDMHIEMVKQHEQAGLLHSNNTNTVVGSGALGYTCQLPNGTGMGVKAAGS